MHATRKSTLKNAKGAYLVGINGKRVFGKEEAISMLRQLCDERAENLQLEPAVERKLSSAETWRAVAEHNIMEPSAVPDAASLQFVTHTLISPSPRCPPKKWKWLCKQFNLKLSLQLSKRLVASPGASCVP